MTGDMFCFGSHEKGALGLGGIEKEVIKTPTSLTFPYNESIVQVSTSENHTAFILSTGETFTCGLNEYGQLGHEKPCRRSGKVDALSNIEVVRVECGSCHTLALNSWGQLHTWGSNSYGQLGHGSNEKQVERVPRMVKQLATLQVVQVCCGNNHNMALTVHGHLYSWGNNAYGQLGLGTQTDNVNQPTLIESLKGLPIEQVAAGGNHSFVLTRSSAIYGWGKNSFGQLGLNHETDRPFPTQLRPLRSQKISYIACGENHTCALTLEGGVFTFGAGMYGQLGHNSSNNESTPRRVMELMGSVVSQVACGRHHTMAYIPSRGKLFGFGLGLCGQLGKEVRHALSPTVINGVWENSFSESAMETNEEEYVMRAVYCGGDQSFVSVTSSSSSISPLDYRERPPRTQIPVLDLELMQRAAAISPSSQIPCDVLSALETSLSSVSCLNASFLLKNDAHRPCSSKNCGLNLGVLVDGWYYLSNAKNATILDLASGGIINNVIPELTSSPPDVEALRVFLVLPFYHEFGQPVNCNDLLLPFGEKILKLIPEANRVLENWWISLPPDMMLRMVTIYKRVVSHLLSLPESRNYMKGECKLPFETEIGTCLNLLKRINDVNMKHGQKVPYHKFYIEEITEKVNVQLDYLHWVFDKDKQGKLYFCNYPFTFDADAKTTLLQTDSRIQMQNAMSEAAQFPFHFLLEPQSQFLVLCVSRENIIRDTLSQLSKQPATDLRKPLKVIFSGEEAVDAGGVRKEFFLLLLKAILDPQYGMFTFYSESNTMWFSDTTFEENIMFYLIGILCGLAIYNFTIIDLPFPLALYRKILGQPVTLEDFAGLSPVTAKGLQDLLDYQEDDVEDVFSLSFELTQEVFGSKVNIELKPGGKDIAVSKQNKHEYVDLYVDWFLNKSIEEKYDAFSNGFLRVCGGKLLQMFHPQELMALVVGNEIYDWDELEKNCEYSGGCSINDTPIRLFWQVFRDLDEKDKRKFLMFLTGTDRIPIRGMKAVGMTIQLTGASVDHLPVAHTCFNVLDLPRYQNKSLLRLKLIQAIQQTKVFALV